MASTDDDIVSLVTWRGGASIHAACIGAGSASWHAMVLTGVIKKKLF